MRGPDPEEDPEVDSVFGRLQPRDNNGCWCGTIFDEDINTGVWDTGPAIPRKPFIWNDVGVDEESVTLKSAYKAAFKAAGHSQKEVDAILGKMLDLDLDLDLDQPSRAKLNEKGEVNQDPVGDGRLVEAYLETRRRGEVDTSDPCARADQLAAESDAAHGRLGQEAAPGDVDLVFEGKGREGKKSLWEAEDGGGGNKKKIKSRRKLKKSKKKIKKTKSLIHNTKLRKTKKNRLKKKKSHKWKSKKKSKKKTKSKK